MSAPGGNITRESWKPILASAAEILDGLERKGFPPPDITIGGGTVLMFRLEHRLSRDIELFLHDVQWITLLTPRLNETTAAMVTDYVEQPNSLKLRLPHGDIDFIVAGSVTDVRGAETLKFMGRTFPLDPSEEILAKKLFYRAAFFQPRDAFDMAAAIEFDRPSATKAARAAVSKLEILNRRLAELAQMPDDTFERILTLGRGEHLIGEMIARVREFINAEAVV
jgi:hypothetical protein